MTLRESTTRTYHSLFTFNRLGLFGWTKNTVFPESSWNSSNLGSILFVLLSCSVNHARRACWSNWGMTSRAWIHSGIPSVCSLQIPTRRHLWCNIFRHNCKTWAHLNRPVTKKMFCYHDNKNNFIKLQHLSTIYKKSALVII